MTAGSREMPPPCEADCVIVGAGVGGSFLALLLGRKGLRVVVVDANPGPGHRGADILKPRAIRLLAEHGLLDRLRSRGALQRDRIDFYHDGVSLLPYDFVEHTELGHYLVVPYVETVGTILEACAELPNVDVRFDSKIAAVTTAGATATEAILHNGARISARAFVDSSGSATPLRDLVRPHFDTLTYDHVLRMATVPLSSESDLRNRLYFGSTGWLAYFYPVTADSARIFLGVPRDQDARSHTGKYLNSLPVLYSFVPEADEAFRHLETAEFEPAPISAYTSKPYHHGNVILLGSSVFACHPMTGQGMSYSMEDAAVLTSILSEARDDLELSRLLDRHYETRRPAHERLVQYGDSLARSFHDKAAYLRAHDAVMHGGDL